VRRRIVLLGHPVAHSLSPRFQNAAIRAAGIDAIYEAIDVPPDQLAATVAALRDTPGSAGNVTVPHKEAMAALCDSLTPLAGRTGAVNTFFLEGSTLVGDNTDVGGFDASARALLGRMPTGLIVGVIGAGGAAAAVLAAVERWPGCGVFVWNRDPSRADRLTSRFGAIARPAALLEIGTADLVVNATTLGMRDSDPLPIDLSRLGGDRAVIDLVYRPGETRLVREARARGLRATDGLTMLLEQGALAFERWFGVAPDRGAMRAELASHRKPKGTSTPNR
jgi:shikimate dehydrogenase